MLNQSTGRVSNSERLLHERSFSLALLNTLYYLAFHIPRWSSAALVIAALAICRDG